jgi:hypothetical protein
MNNGSKLWSVTRLELAQGSYTASNPQAVNALNCTAYQHFRFGSILSNGRNASALQHFDRLKKGFKKNVIGS